MDELTEKFVNCFQDDIAWFYLDTSDEIKENIIMMKLEGKDERELLEILVRR